MGKKDSEKPYSTFTVPNVNFERNKITTVRGDSKVKRCIRTLVCCTFIFYPHVSTFPRFHISTKAETHTQIHKRINTQTHTSIKKSTNK